jgi:cyclohexanone monooxygenase
LHGITTRGFPNFLFTVFTQGALAATTTLGYDRQAIHIAYIIKEALRRGVGTIEPTEEARLKLFAMAVRLM